MTQFQTGQITFEPFKKLTLLVYNMSLNHLVRVGIVARKKRLVSSQKENIKKV